MTLSDRNAPNHKLNHHDLLVRLYSQKTVVLLNLGTIGIGLKVAIHLQGN
jgi:hypothetical protein